MPLSDGYRGSFRPFWAVSTHGSGASMTSIPPSTSRWATTLPPPNSALSTPDTCGRSHSSATIAPTSELSLPTPLTPAHTRSNPPSFRMAAASTRAMASALPKVVSPPVTCTAASAPRARPSRNVACTRSGP